MRVTKKGLAVTMSLAEKGFYSLKPILLRPDNLLRTADKQNSLFHQGVCKFMIHFTLGVVCKIGMLYNNDIVYRIIASN